jgi:hypothetical protein
MITALLIGFLVMAGLALKILIVQFVAGRLAGRGLNSETERLSRPRSRFAQDLQPREDLLVEYVAHSKELAIVLGVLAAWDKPLSFATIVHELRTGRNHSLKNGSVPANLVGPALFILHGAGLVRLKRDGFMATKIGRKVQRRIEAEPLLIELARSAATQPNATKKLLPITTEKSKAPMLWRRYWRSRLRRTPIPRYPRLAGRIGELRRPAASNQSSHIQPPTQRRRPGRRGYRVHHRSLMTGRNQSNQAHLYGTFRKRGDENNNQDDTETTQHYTAPDHEEPNYAAAQKLPALNRKTQERIPI